MENKQCPKCKKVKLVSEFSKNKNNSDGLQSYCKICMQKLMRDYQSIPENKAKMKKQQKEYKNRPEIKINRKEYFKKYHSTVEYKAKVNKYIKDRKKTDLNFKITYLLRNRQHSALKNQDATKASNTIYLLGCSKIFYNVWLELQFDNKMNWDNQGTYWHVDHIRPCASFDLNDPEQQKACFNFKNQRPLEAFDNISKSNKIIKGIKIKFQNKSLRHIFTDYINTHKI